MDRGCYRATYVAIVDDPGFQELTPNERLVLWTLKNTTIGNYAGIFVYYAGTLEAQTGLDGSLLEGALKGLERARWVARERNVIWVRNQLRFDPANPLADLKKVKGVANILAALPRLAILRSFCAYYKLSVPDSSWPVSLSEGASEWLRSLFVCPNEAPSLTGFRIPEQEQECIVPKGTPPTTATDPPVAPSIAGQPEPDTEAEPEPEPDPPLATAALPGLVPPPGRNGTPPEWITLIDAWCNEFGHEAYSLTGKEGPQRKQALKDALRIASVEDWLVGIHLYATHEKFSFWRKNGFTDLCRYILRGPKGQSPRERLTLILSAEEMVLEGGA